MGTGAFEGIRGYNIPKGTCIFRLDDHIKRLFASVSVFGKSMPWSMEEVKQAVIDVAAANRCSSVYVRPLFYLGGETLHINAAESSPHLLIVSYDLTNHYNKPERLCVSKLHRISPQAAPLDKKITGYYINSFLALHEANLAGFEDALMLDDKDNIAEATHANIAFVHQDVISTPTQYSILPGITRATLIQLAQENNIPFVVRDIDVETARSAEAAFMMGTMKEITPLQQLDTTPYDSAHPMIIKCIRLYNESVRPSTTTHPEWVTAIHF